MGKIHFYYRRMATSLNFPREIKSFVFMDLETTGLPFLENNTTKITEICLTVVQSNHLRLGVFPRVQNKLNLCVNPRKLISIESEKITGLNNFLLEESCTFSKAVTTVNNFLENNSEPICLVAHNGFKFDYPIFKREIEKSNISLKDNILCIDSLQCFRSLLKDDLYTDVVDKSVPVEFTPMYDELLFSCETQKLNETTPVKRSNEANYSANKKFKVENSRKKLNFGTSFKLADVFTRLTKKEPIRSHEADGDVQMLIMCAATLGDKFVDWANRNAINFSDIPAMTPGKKIGT